MKDDTVSDWIAELKEGESLALQKLFACYYEPVIRFVQQRLPTRLRRSADEEDVAAAAIP